MPIVYHCSACQGTHRSRLLARGLASFSQVIPEVGEVTEVCPATGRWIWVDYEDLDWREMRGRGARAS